MKRCPECRRDYFDDSLLYCLEDGTALIQGSVPSPDEPSTAILPRTSLSSEAATQAQIVTAEQTAAQPTGASEAQNGRGFDKRFLLIPLVAAIVIIGSLVYRFYPASSSGAITSIAVLPLENKSSDPDTDYLSEGLAESLIFRLAQLPGLKVSPTSSVMRYKGKELDNAKVAKELGVDAVMSGRVVEHGDNLTVSVELVDARNDKLLWGEQHERKMSDLLATQREIAAMVVQKLQVKLVGDEKALSKKYTTSNEAYQLWMKGRYHFARRTSEDMFKSIDLFQQAVKLDPNFALAYVGLAESYATIPSYPYGSPKDCVPPAKAAAAKALELDPDLPEAHTVSGLIAASLDWDYPKAESEFKRALELDPNLAITHFRYAWVYLSPMGRHDEAIAEMKRAMELEPLSIQQGANYAAVLLYARRFDEALEQAKRTVELDPTHVGARNWLVHAYNAKGMYAEALAIAEKSNETETRLTLQTAYAFAKLGRREEALATLRKADETEKTRYIMRYWTRCNKRCSRRQGRGVCRPRKGISE